MIENIAVISAFVAGGLGIIYFGVIIVRRKSKPQLIDLVVIIASSVGLISAINLGYFAVIAEDSRLGDLVNQRIPILVGAVAICWVSVDAIVKVYYCHLTAGTGDE